MLFSNKQTIGIFLKAFLLAALFLAGYYFLLLKPRYEVTNELLAAETQVAQLQANLVESRLTILELSELDDQSPIFREQRASLVQSLKDLQAQGLELLDNEFPSELADLIKTHEHIFQQQQSLIDGLEAGDDQSSQLESEVISAQKQLIDQYDLFLKKLSDLK